MEYVLGCSCRSIETSFPVNFERFTDRRFFIFQEMSNSGSPPAEPGGYPRAITTAFYWRGGSVVFDAPVVDGKNDANRGGTESRSNQRKAYIRSNNPFFRDTCSEI
ncbi:MAG: hypothetical protein PHY29_08765 [Syntrophales bacterium]|nr:hypothetical protein [Syntrophales bacterium]